MFNPYYPNYPNYQNYTQNYQTCAQNLERGIVRVNGIQGAQAYQMGAKSPESKMAAYYNYIVK